MECMEGLKQDGVRVKKRWSCRFRTGQTARRGLRGQPCLEPNPTGTSQSHTSGSPRSIGQPTPENTHFTFKSTTAISRQKLFFSLWKPPDVGLPIVARTSKQQHAPFSPMGSFLQNDRSANCASYSTVGVDIIWYQLIKPSHIYSALHFTLDNRGFSEQDLLAAGHALDGTAARQCVCYVF